MDAQDPSHRQSQAAPARNASSVTDYFNIPTNRVIEFGTKIEI